MLLQVNGSMAHQGIGKNVSMSADTGAMSALPSSLACTPPRTDVLKRVIIGGLKRWRGMPRRSWSIPWCRRGRNTRDASAPPGSPHCIWVCRRVLKIIRVIDFIGGDWLTCWPHSIGLPAVQLVNPPKDLIMVIHIRGM